MKRWTAATTATAAGVLILAAAPAQAQQVSVTDPAGDSSGRGLDITGAQIRNRDSAILSSVSFARDVRGDVIVSLGARHGSGVRVVYEHRIDRLDRTYVVAGAFTPARAADSVCEGASGDWHPRSASVTLRLPSHCLDDGDYGAVRAAVLTEGRGADVDFAPEQDNGNFDFTDWIPRG